MTPLRLVDDLAEECRCFLAAQIAKGANGEYRPVNVYAHELPARTQLDDPAFFPFILVRFEKAEQQKPGDPITSKVTFIAGTYDDNDLPGGAEEREDFQGWRDPFTLLWKLSSHMLGKRILCGMYEIAHPWSIEMPEESSYPFFFAAMSCSFLSPGLPETEVQLSGLI